jgi:hypothetical protein
MKNMDTYTILLNIISILSTSVSGSSSGSVSGSKLDISVLGGCISKFIPRAGTPLGCLT